MMAFDAFGHDCLYVGIVALYRLQFFSRQRELRRSVYYRDEIEAGRACDHATPKPAGHYVEDVETLVNRRNCLIDEEMTAERKYPLRSQKICLYSRSNVAIV